MSNGSTVIPNEEADEAPAKRGRPPGKTKRVRRNYATELQSLESRVGMALRILKKVQVDASMSHGAAIVAVVIETLEGKD